MKSILLVSTFEDGAYAHIVRKNFIEMGYIVFPFDHRVLYKEGMPSYQINHQFEAICTLDPDIIFTIKGRGLDPKVIKKQSAHKVLWWLDNAKRFPDFEEYIDAYDKYYLIEEGQGHPWMSIGIDPDIHRPLHSPKNSAFIDVVFAGTAHKQRSTRIIQILQHLNAIVAIFGNAWSAETPYYRGRAIYWDELMRVYTLSKLILNNHYIKGITPNMRAIEAPASGSAMISDTGTGLNSCLKPGEEFIPYDTIREARYMISKYLEEELERERIARNGHARVLKDHLLKDKLKKMLKV